MSNVVNLNQFRKKRARADKETRAEENRMKHGRRKDEAASDKAAKQQGEAFLDGHQRDDEDR